MEAPIILIFESNLEQGYYVYMTRLKQIIRWEVFNYRWTFYGIKWIKDIYLFKDGRNSYNDAWKSIYWCMKHPWNLPLCNLFKYSEIVEALRKNNKMFVLLANILRCGSLDNHAAKSNQRIFYINLIITIKKMSFKCS